MTTPVLEVIDLTLTQAIERYMEMEPNMAYDAILREWPEQLAALLVEFFFKSTCGICGGMPDFIQLPREDDNTNYIVPLCSCDWREDLHPKRPTLNSR